MIPIYRNFLFFAVEKKEEPVRLEHLNEDWNFFRTTMIFSNKYLFKFISDYLL